MSDNQRRFYCRILFLCLCALPTVLSAYWIFHPQTSENWETLIQAQLGVTTKIDSIETPWPNETILYNLEFSDPDKGVMFKTVEARIRFGETIVIRFPHRVHGLNNEGISHLIKSINQHLSRSPRLEKRWSLVFEEDTVFEKFAATPRGPMDELVFTPRITVSDLQIDVVPLVEGVSATMQFRLAESKNDPSGIEPGWESQERPLVVCEISQTRNQGNVIELTTHGVALPVWLVSDVAPIVSDSLGSGAWFTGEIKLCPTPDRSWVDIDCQFTNVTLARYPNGVNQFATIELERCKFVDGIPTEWNAELFLNATRQRRRIRVESMMVPGQAIDPIAAISASLGFPMHRSAHLEPDVN